MKIERIEDLEIWQEARELCRLVFKLTSVVPFAQDYRFRDQIRASSGSIMDNMAEGFGRGGNREFVNFLSIAKGSCEEVRSQAYRALDFNYIDQETLDEILTRTENISKRTNAFIQYLRKSSFKGSKFNKTNQ